MHHSMCVNKDQSNWLLSSALNSRLTGKSHYFTRLLELWEFNCFLWVICQLQNINQGLVGPCPVQVKYESQLTGVTVPCFKQAGGGWWKIQSLGTRITEHHWTGNVSLSAVPVLLLTRRSGWRCDVNFCPDSFLLDEWVTSPKDYGKGGNVLPYAYVGGTVSEAPQWFSHSHKEKVT